MKLIQFISSFFISTFLYSQMSSSYSLDAKLDFEFKTIQIDQKIKILNNEAVDVDTLFFNDWSNSYSNSKSQLAQKLAEEFDRSFYISSRKSKGNTIIKSLTIEDQTNDWNRLKDQNDILYVVLQKPLKQNDSISLAINYSIKIPDNQFTGFGYKKNMIYIKDFIISLSPFYKGKWIIDSNLNLNDNSLFKSKYFIRWKYPKNLHLLSSMNKINSFSKDQDKTAFYESRYERSPKFIFSKDNKIREFKHGNIKIFTDIFESSEKSPHIKIDRIYSFLSKNIKTKNQKQSYLITNYEFESRPINGLNLFPKIISPFSKEFIDEIKFLKTFTSEYVKHQFSNLNFRENHWLSDGLTIYLIIKYIEINYPDQKLVGKLADIPIINKYSLSKLKFNEIFMINSELMLRRYLHQSATTPKDLLIKYNERIASSYHVGLFFRYLEDYIGDESFRFVLNEIHTVKNLDDLVLSINKYSNKIDSSNLIKYLNSKHTLDFKIENVVKSHNKISVFTKQISNQNIPFKVSILKDNNIIDSKWITGDSKKPIVFYNNEANYVAINPIIGLPELSKLNNWRSINNTFIGKPLSIRLFKDSEDPTKNQILVNPTGFYNLYDGASFGARFHNKTLQPRYFTYIIDPMYSSIEKTLVGSIMTDYKYYNDFRSNYLTQFSFFGSSFHYAPNSLYKIAVPSLKFYFRPSNLRDNLRQVLSLSWYSIQRESINLENKTPNYSLGEIKYKLSDKGSVNYFTFENSLEIARNFKKLIFEIEYRKLFKSGRLFSSRLFFGTFINNSIGDNKYFNFNLNKPNDYLFEYAYFGRSETEGLFSQQFIMNEGGFKSIIPDTSSDKWILSSNFSMGIWRWFEGYMDFGLLKNTNQNIRSFYDYGFRLNFLPDYLELYFPVGSSHENSLVKENYSSKIRFVLSLNPKDIATFFSRTWF